MTAGLHDDQFYWFNLCSAYTGQRAQKLTRQCDRTPRRVAAVDRLRKGLHPTTDSVLITQPRRLCKRDVGTSYWSGEGCPEDNWLALHGTDDDCALVFQHAVEEDWEDPLDREDPLLGFDIM